jgi:hypothetical protein
MNKGFASIGLVFLAFVGTSLISEIYLIQEKELNTAVLLMNSFNSVSLKRTETEILFDEAIEKTITDCAENLIFSSEIINTRIAEKIFSETAENCFIGKETVSIEKIKLNSVVFVVLDEKTYLIEFNYFGTELICFLNSGKIISTVQIPKGFTLIKGGLIAVN